MRIILFLLLWQFGFGFGFGSSLTALDSTYAFTAQNYLERFTAYSQWNEHLPDVPSNDFLNFINSRTPLANRLRNKWLYQLANKKDWLSFSHYYEAPDSVALQCYASLAQYYQGKTSEALRNAKNLWLTGDLQPSACNELFKILLSHPSFDKHLIRQRIILALEKKNITLVRLLLKQYMPQRPREEQLVSAIHQNPEKIMHLEPGDLHDFFYLYGLKRLVGINMDKALKYWHNPKTQKMLSEPQKQNFLVHLATYKAMRNHDDTGYWFYKVNPLYYTGSLLDWQIRLALKRHNWARVEHFIRNYKHDEEPTWQYWLARSLEMRGNTKDAYAIYENLSKNRNYYGFLSSLRLRKPFYFGNEYPISDSRILSPYRPFLETIRFLYMSKQILSASRLLNDFLLELPKADKSAVIFWLSKELKWHDKTIVLSNTPELNNQLALRFPLGFPLTIREYSAQFRIPAALVYAIIRQESGFREDVTSSAGARGLMQIMPMTAKLVANKKNIAYTNPDQLFISHKNILIGTAYLQWLIKQYDHFALVAAAYNAGPSQVNRWLKAQPSSEVDIWIETIPWQETRNYLKNIISFYLVYQYQIGQMPNLNEFMKPLTA